MVDKKKKIFGRIITVLFINLFFFFCFTGLVKGSSDPVTTPLFLCLKEGESYSFSSCNPLMTYTRYCPGTCMYCVAEKTKGVYCPINFGLCDFVTTKRVYLNGSIIDPQNITNINITLISPSNGFTTNYTSIEFNYNLRSTNNLLSCNLFLNGVDDIKNSSILMTSQNKILKEFTPGLYNWGIKCKYRGGKTEISELRFLSITNNPIINETNNTEFNCSYYNNCTIIPEYNCTYYGNCTLEDEIHNCTDYNNCTIILDPQENTNTKTGGSSGGGGGTGSICMTRWNCSDWSICENSLQTRICSYPSWFCKPIFEKPIENRSCVMEYPNQSFEDILNTEQANNNSSNNLSNENKNSSDIVNVVLGYAGPNILYDLVILIVVVGILFFLGARSNKFEFK